MIRFLNLKNQICEGDKNFAFFDTITNEIISFNGEQVFDDLEDFIDAYNKSNNTQPLNRFTDLIPDKFFNNKK